MAAKDITLDIVQKWFTYDNKTGSLTRIARPYNSTAQLGVVEVSPNVKGYLTVRVFIPHTGKSEKGFIHRMAYMLETGAEIPDGKNIDHINGKRDDNRFENLRLVTTGENNKNKRRYINNMSGVSGIVWCRYNFWWEVWSCNDYIAKTTDFTEARRLKKEADTLRECHDNHGSVI